MSAPGQAVPLQAGGVDPVTFEVIRHRLWAINDDQGRMAARMSASPTVFDAYDFNSALITADGRGLYTGAVYSTGGARVASIAQEALFRKQPGTAAR